MTFEAIYVRFQPIHPVNLWSVCLILKSNKDVIDQITCYK